MFGQAIIAMVWGIFLHQSEPFILALNTNSEAMTLMSRYGVGVVGTAPVVDMFMKLMGLDRKTRLLAMVAYFLGFIFVGIGVFIARVPRNLNSTVDR